MRIQKRVSAQAVCTKPPSGFRCIRSLPLHVAKLRDIAMVRDSHPRPAGSALLRMHAESASALSEHANLLPEVGKLLLLQA